MRLYLDSAPIIYWVEKIAAYYPQVDANGRGELILTTFCGRSGSAVTGFACR